MRAEGAVLGGEGNGGVIDPRVGFVRDSFVAMALVLDLLAETGEPLSRLVDALPRFAMVKHQYPLAGPAGAEAVAALWDRIGAGVPDGGGRPPRRAPPGMARPLGPRPGQQHRADRPGDRRGRRRALGPSRWPGRSAREVTSGGR